MCPPVDPGGRGNRSGSQVELPARRLVALGDTREAVGAVYVAGRRILPGRYEPAGQARRIVALEAMFMLGFGPRLPQALSALDQLFTKTMRS